MKEKTENNLKEILERLFEVTQADGFIGYSEVKEIMEEEIEMKNKKKENLIKILKECIKNEKGDPEEYHITADQSLLKYIGDKEIAELFDEIYKWYS